MPDDVLQTAPRTTHDCLLEDSLADRDLPPLREAGESIESMLISGVGDYRIVDHQRLARARDRTATIIE